MSRKSVCVDLDGVLASYDEGWQGIDHIGDPIPGSIEFTKRLIESFDVMIYTTRCNPEVNNEIFVGGLVKLVRDWLDKHGYSYSTIYAGVGKPIASAYIDDKGITCIPSSSGDGNAELYNGIVDSLVNQ